MYYKWVSLQRSTKIGTLEIWSPKFTINYTKRITKEKRQQRTNLENQLKKILKKCLSKDDNLSKYNAIKNELDPIYDHVTEVICIRSKCEWNENKKKSTKFFLNLEKQRGAQNTIKELTFWNMN